MLTLGPYSTRLGRLISLARIGFSAAAVLVLIFDPHQLVQFQLLGYVILIAYVVWAALVAVYLHRQAWLRPVHELIVYAVDVPVIAFVMVLTEGDTSPFFVFFTFILVAAMLRWSWQGVLWAALAVLLVFCVVTLLFDEEIDLGRVVVRCLYLAILTTMLGIIAAHQARVRAELTRLAGPQIFVADTELPTAQLLAYAASVFQAPRALLLWSDPEEPWIYSALHIDGRCTVERTSPDSGFPVLPEALQSSTFLTTNAGTAKRSIIVQRDNQLESWDGASLDDQFQKRYEITSMVTAPLAEGTYEGRIFILDPPDLNSDQLLIVQVIAEQIARRFELHDAVRRLQKASVEKERMRLARDLHDGVLQLLAGASLQLQSMRQFAGDKNTTLSRQISSLQLSIGSHQRAIREFVDSLKPTRIGLAGHPEDLSAGLSSIAEILENQWHVGIGWTVFPPSVRVPEPIVIHIQNLVAEATANARKHGAATRLTIDVKVHDQCVELAFADNGAGLVTPGHWEMEELAKLNLGPVMLRERVRSAGGTMSVTSSSEGTSLFISIPLAHTEHTHDFAPAVG